ncbi:hypothetical protein [Okeania sp. KiyG1]|uniref:hypothetical protein n=1 Tax=Okeania sp. KiyG1 TaxID=2720165 RepID=UPI001920BFBD|nr:hypothetical protein [Okeania sp. KiyG1]
MMGCSRRKKEEGRRKKEEGRRKRGDGDILFTFDVKQVWEVLGEREVLSHIKQRYQDAVIKKKQK